MWAQLAGVLLLMAAGFLGRDMYQAWKERGALRAQLEQTEQQAATLDKTVLDKLQEDARIDAGVARVTTKRREMKSQDEAYRQYLDRPLPERTLQLYRDAAAARRAAQHPGPDGTGAASE
jgi:erythromycin esterase-like protein